MRQKTGASTWATVSSFTYDGTTPAHRPKTMTDGAGRTTTYTYNATNAQVATVTNAKGEVTTSTYHLTSGSAHYGKLLTLTGDVPGDNRTYTYDSAGRVRTMTDSEGYTYEYDLNGNTRFEKTAAGVVVREFQWDQENRLVKIIAGTKESQFTYDGESKRVRIRELDGGAETSNQTFVWCGIKPCQKRGSTGGTVVRSYLENGFEEGADDYAETKDHLGTIREVVASNGTSIGSAFAFTPWGWRSQVGGSGAASDSGFTGHLLHGPAPSILLSIGDSPVPQAGGYHGTRLRSLAVSISTDTSGTPPFRWSTLKGLIRGLLA